jgi:hypothetical protein
VRVVPRGHALTCDGGARLGKADISSPDCVGRSAKPFGAAVFVWTRGSVDQRKFQAKKKNISLVC